MQAHPGRSRAPVLGPVLRIGQIGERLAGEEPRTYCTTRSTRALSLGERTRAGSV